MPPLWMLQQLEDRKQRRDAAQASQPRPSTAPHPNASVRYAAGPDTGQYVVPPTPSRTIHPLVNVVARATQTMPPLRQGETDTVASPRSNNAAVTRRDAVAGTTGHASRTQHAASSSHQSGGMGGTTTGPPQTADTSHQLTSTPTIVSPSTFLFPDPPGPPPPPRSRSQHRKVDSGVVVDGHSTTSPSTNSDTNTNPNASSATHANTSATPARSSTDPNNPFRDPSPTNDDSEAARLDNVEPKPVSRARKMWKKVKKTWRD